MPRNHPRWLPGLRIEPMAVREIPDCDDLALRDDERDPLPEPWQYTALLQPFSQRPAMPGARGPKQLARRPAGHLKFPRQPATTQSNARGGLQFQAAERPEIEDRARAPGGQGWQ